MMIVGGVVAAAALGSYQPSRIPAYVMDPATRTNAMAMRAKRPTNIRSCNTPRLDSSRMIASSSAQSAVVVSGPRDPGTLRSVHTIQRGVTDERRNGIRFDQGAPRLQQQGNGRTRPARARFARH